MASAGRILIMPRGNWNAETEYKMLDLVFRGGASWIAKKNVVGIEPTEANSEYWMKMCEGTDLTEIKARLEALENQMVSATSLDDIDLSGYATKEEVSTISNNVGDLTSAVSELSTDVSKLSADVEAVEETVSGLSGEVGGIKAITDKLPSSFLNIQLVTYQGSNRLGEYQPSSITLDFAPRVLFMLGCSNLTSSSNYDLPMRSNENISDVIFCDRLSTSYQSGKGFINTYETSLVTRKAKKSEDGKTIYWYVTGSESSGAQCDAEGNTYYVLAIG